VIVNELRVMRGRLIPSSRLAFVHVKASETVGLFCRRGLEPGRNPPARGLHTDGGDDRREQHKAGERVEPVIEASRAVLDPAHDKRP
jgi:hypothetical protein